MDDEDSLPGFGVALLHIVHEGGIGGAPPIPTRPHRQETRRLVDHDDVAVLMKDLDPHGLMSAAGMTSAGHPGTIGINDPPGKRGFCAKKSTIKGSVTDGS